MEDTAAKAGKDTVLALARTLASHNAHVEAMALMNRPVELEKRLEQDAQYRIAKDRAMKAHDDYQTAFDEWVMLGCPE